MKISDVIDRFRGQKLPPGAKCPKSGQYRNSTTQRQATCVSGERMPPGPKGSTWKLTDVTRHKEA